MAIVKKKLDLDDSLVEKLRIHLGEDFSLTPIVTSLLWALVRELEGQEINLPETITKAAKYAREEISEST